jgi:molybdate transport system permease protein
VAGNIPGRTRTASIAIYDAVQGDRLDEAHLLALLLALMAGGVLLLLTRIGGGTRW